MCRVDGRFHLAERQRSQGRAGVGKASCLRLSGQRRVFSLLPPGESAGERQSGRATGQPPTMDGFLPVRHQLPPLGPFPRTKDVETLLDRLDAGGLTWKV
jgi:hypothetical protein